jgi:hypothetical protein
MNTSSLVSPLIPTFDQTNRQFRPIGDPTVACVWRRQTFTAAVEQCTPDMSKSILQEHIPTLIQTLAPTGDLPTSTAAILESAYNFSRMLHSASTSSTDAFYRAFVPEVGSTLYPRQIELVKRCMRSERGDVDRGMFGLFLSYDSDSLFYFSSWCIHFPRTCKGFERTDDAHRGKYREYSSMQFYSFFTPLADMCVRPL